MFTFFNNIFHQIGATVGALLIATGSLLGGTPAVVEPIATSTLSEIGDVSKTALVEEVEKTVEIPSLSISEKTATQPATQPSVSTAPQQTQVVHEGRNYHADAVNRAQRVIAIQQSFELWLQDTNSQLRSASLTLASYPSVGGLYDESRDAAIDLANAEIKVVSALQTNAKETIVYWDAILNYLKTHPDEYVEKSSFDRLKTPEDVEEDVNGVKDKISDTLDSVLASLRYHY